MATVEGLSLVIPADMDITDLIPGKNLLIKTKRYPYLSNHLIALSISDLLKNHISPFKNLSPRTVPIQKSNINPKKVPKIVEIHTQSRFKTPFPTKKAPNTSTVSPGTGGIRFSKTQKNPKTRYI